MTPYQKAMTSGAFPLFAAFFLALALTAMAYAQAKDGKGQSAPRQVEVLGTQLLRIHSAIVEQDYDLYVNIPRNYRDTTRRFPVLYLLDAQYDFSLLNGVYGEQYYDGFVPDLIIVGITWAGEHANYDSLRARDYTPTVIKQVPYAGNAPKYLAFIKNELIPFIASKYRVDKTDRGLMGSSLGGLFTLYAMFHETDLFTRYVLTSPSLMWDNNVLYKYEEAYHAKNTRLPVRLFMAIGGLEGADAMFGKFADLLRSRNYEGLQMETKVLEGMGHSGSKSEGFARGLQWVFARTPKKLDPKTLDGYAGRYRLNPEVAVDLVKENDHLVLVTPDSQRVPLFSESGDDFFVKGFYLFLKFRRGAAGAVTGVHVEQFSAAYDMNKE